MPIKTRLTKAEFDGLTERQVSVDALYKEDSDGSMVLNAEAVGGLQVADVSQMQSTMEAARRAEGDARRELGPWKPLISRGINPADVDSRLAEADRVIKEGASVDEVRGQLKKEYDTKLLEERGLREKAEHALSGMRLSSAVSAEIGDAIPDRREMLETFVRSSVREFQGDDGSTVLGVVDRDGKRLFSKADPSRYMSPSEFVQGLRESKSYGEFFIAKDQGGDGAGGGGGEVGDISTNCFAVGDAFNSHKATSLEGSNPNLAAKLKAQAKAAGKLHPLFADD